MVCEIRYQDGQLYLDHCGRFLKRLLHQAPEWVLAAEPTPQGTSLYNLRSGSRLGVSIAAASLTLDKTSGDELIDSDEVATFLGQLDSTLSLVLDELEATRYLRLGYREQYYFPFETKEEAEGWLLGLGLVSVAPDFVQVFAGELDGLGLAFTLRGQECRYTVKLNGIERSAQIPVGDVFLSVRPSSLPSGQRKAALDALKRKRQRQVNSAFAALLDIDAYLNEPEELNLHAFVEEHANGNIRRFIEAIPKDRGRRGT